MRKNFRSEVYNWINVASIIAGPSVNGHVATTVVKTSRHDYCQRHRLTTHLAVFDVLLPTHRTIDGNLKRLSAVWAINLLGLCHAGHSPRGLWTSVRLNCSSDHPLIHPTPEHETKNEGVTRHAAAWGRHLATRTNTPDRLETTQSEDPTQSSP
jgi:hypothetical protein